MTRNVEAEERKGPVEGGPETGRMTGEARRQQLIEVAIRLFSQKGFRGTTTKEIALAARVNEAIIFRHFATKEDLYAAILDYKASEIRVDEWLEELNEYALRNDYKGLFGSLASRIVEHHRCDDNFLRLMLYSSLEGHELSQIFFEKHVKPINEFLYGYVAGRQRAGDFREGNPKAIVRAFIGMVIHHVLSTRLFDFESTRISDEEALETFTQLFLDGLRIAPASKSGR
ncbi:MAG TPA: TetR/AcrR family transcriptional regulator [Blastocatellia bacterium]|nr:TetR/AcrR family transcriptional regulator [Blastocatellia bacterium]